MTINYKNVIFLRRLRSRNSIISRRQIVLHAIRSLWYTLNTGAVDRTRRPIDDTHHQISTLPQQPSRTFVSAIHN